MQNNVKITCTMFEHDMWLYLDRALPDEKMEFWRSHLRLCDKCKNLLNQTEELVSNVSDRLLFDLDENVFDGMIAKAIKKKKLGILELLSKKRKQNIASIGKIVFASILVIVAIVVSMLSDKPNTLKTVSKELLDWDGKSIRAQLYDISYRIELIRTDNMDKWNLEVNTIDSRLNDLENQSNPESFY